MPDRQKMNPVLFYIERVNDPIVADASSETIRPFQPMMLERAELRTNLINFCFNSRAESGWKLEKCSVKTRVIKPESPRSRAFRLTHARGFSSGHVAFRLLNRIFELGSEFQLVFDEII